MQWTRSVALVGSGLALALAGVPDASAGLLSDAFGLVNLLPGGGMSAQSAGGGSCGGIAPQTNSCSRGIEADPGSMSVGVRGGFFTGTVTARLVDADGSSFQITCNYVAGTSVRVGPVTIGSGCSQSQSGDMNAGALTLLGFVSGTGAGPWEVYAE